MLDLFLLSIYAAVLLLISVWPGAPSGIDHSIRVRPSKLLFTSYILLVVNIVLLFAFDTIISRSLLLSKSVIQYSLISSN